MLARRIIAAVAAAAFVAYVAVYPTLLTWHHHKEPLDYGIVIAAVGAVYLAVGFYARWTRRNDRLGLLMILVGLAWLSYQLSWLPDPAGYLQFAFSNFELPFLVWLALAYPSGRLAGRLERAVVIAGFAAWIWGQVANTLTSNLNLCDAPTCSPSRVLVQPEGALAQFSFTTSNYIGLAVVAAVLVLVVRRWRAASPRARRSVVPLVWMAGPPAAWGITGLLIASNRWYPPGAVYPWFNLALASIPVGYVYSRVRDRLGRGRVGELILGLGAGGSDLRGALARTLHDPSIEIGYWLPEEGRYADLGGSEVRLPEAGDSRRAATVLERDGQPLAAIVHDAAVADDPELMSAATAAVRMALERDRLQSLVRAQLDEVRASRARIVAAQDDERRRLERDLHDGAQQRLVTLSLALGQARSRLDDRADAALRSTLDAASSEVGAALAELRDLAHGIHPAVLTRAGLVPAIRSLAERSAVPVEVEAEEVGRLPSAVEAAGFFVVSEALVNAAKHAAATAVVIRVTRAGGVIRLEITDDGRGGADLELGTGLRGLADRVRAADGRFSLTSSAGRGTSVVAELPCA